MQAMNGSGGLCLTCNNAPGCYYRARRGPALFCELFDSYAAPIQRSRRQGNPAPAGASVALRVTDDDCDCERYSGLCMNCRNRATCKHPKPAGGIWHCEDYD